MIAPPARTLRHFPCGFDPAAPGARGGAIARLLEEGDRRDLAWLTSEIDRRELAAWLERHGARRLSRRSRAFWFAACGFAPAARHAAAEALWPLA